MLSLDPCHDFQCVYEGFWLEQQVDSPWLVQSSVGSLRLAAVSPEVFSPYGTTHLCYHGQCNKQPALNMGNAAVHSSALLRLLASKLKMTEENWCSMYKKKTVFKGMHTNLATKQCSSRIKFNFLTESLVQGPTETRRMFSAEFFGLWIKSFGQNFLLSPIIHVSGL